MQDTADMPPLFDTHCHFDFPEFNGKRELIWRQCQQAGIHHLLVPGVAPSQWQHLQTLSSEFPGIYHAAGIHPWYIKDLQDYPLTASTTYLWTQQLEADNCIAIGECGMDKMINTPMSIQQTIFEYHLQLACDYALPIIIHARKTHNETLNLLKTYQPKAGGVIHGFSGSTELAKQYWSLGFYLGVGGTITYDRAKKTRQTVKQMPLDCLLLETDAPDMPLNGFQGQANTPLQTIAVAETLSQLRNESMTAITKTTTSNAYQLFAL